MYSLINQFAQLVVGAIPPNHVADYEWLLQNTAHLTTSDYQRKYRLYWAMNVAQLSPPFYSAYFGALGAALKQTAQFVKCTLGTPDERRQGTFALQTAVVVVVDISAVATVRLIGIENLLLDVKRFRFQMSEGTFNELQETLVGDLFSGSTSGTIQYRDGVTSMTEETIEQKSELRSKDQGFLERLKAVVEIVPVMELSAVEPAKREPLEEMFGQYGAETMVLAANPASVLWTDDLVQAEMAKNEFGVKRTWTELVAEQTAIAGQITYAERSEWLHH
jgi:hypothetical protein